MYIWILIGWTNGRKEKVEKQQDTKWLNNCQKTVKGSLYVIYPLIRLIQFIIFLLGQNTQWWCEKPVTHSHVGSSLVQMTGIAKKSSEIQIHVNLVVSFTFQNVIIDKSYSWIDKW